MNDETKFSISMVIVGLFFGAFLFSFMWSTTDAENSIHCRDACEYLNKEQVTCITHRFSSNECVCGDEDERAVQRITYDRVVTVVSVAGALRDVYCR